MDDRELRDKKDRQIEPTPKELEADLNVPSVAGCPTCGNEDIQSAELLLAWKETEDVKAELDKLKADIAGGKIFSGGIDPAESFPDKVKISIDWKKRYETIKNAYVKTRLEVSGSFGNWDYNTRKRVLEHEISTELGFVV